MNVARGSAMLLSCLCFGSFTWAVRGLFRAENGMPARMRWLSAVGTICFAAQLWAILRADLSPTWTVIGISLYVVVLTLFWWAVPYARSAALRIAFSPSESNQLIRTGPYHYVRHPFYTSYLLFWVAGVVASESIWLGSTVIVMAAFYFTAIRQEEREFLCGPLASEYLAYQRLAGMLLPKLNSRARRFRAEVK